MPVQSRKGRISPVVRAARGCAANQSVLGGSDQLIVDSTTRSTGRWDGHEGGGMKSFNRTARTVSTLAAIGLGGALVAIALPSSPAHASAPFAAYSATVNPANVKFSTTNVETVVFTNQSPLNSLDFATHATVSFPGFSGVSAPATVTDSAGNPWVVTVSQQTVSLSASNGGTPPSGTLSVPVTAKAPSSTRDVAIPT